MDTHLDQTILRDRSYGFLIDKGQSSESVGVCSALMYLQS